MHHLSPEVSLFVQIPHGTHMIYKNRKDVNANLNGNYVETKLEVHRLAYIVIFVLPTTKNCVGSVSSALQNKLQNVRKIKVNSLKLANH